LTTAVKPRLIFEAARRDDPAAKQAVEKIVDDLAFATMWLGNALDIGHIVIAGSWLRAADLIMPLLEQRLNGWTMPYPHITVAKLGDEASLIGAVRMAIRIAEPI
jgi:glucokinase